MSNTPAYGCYTLCVARCVALATVVVCMSATDVAALDGRVDVRGYQQGGRAGDLSYTTENVWENYSLDQRFRLTRSTMFEMRYGFQRENLWSRTGVGSSEFLKETHVPFAALTFRTQRLRAGVTGNGLRKDTYVPGPGDRRDESITMSAWTIYHLDRAELSARYLDTQIERTQDIEKSKADNSIFSFVARFDATANDRLRYSLNNTRNEQKTLGTETYYLNNTLEYRGNHRFDENRGRFNVTTIASRFDQTNRFPGDAARVYISPIWGGVLLDDTPEEQDPLEPDPVPEDLLYDNNVENPTMINIGSSAPAVREFGGDYRNIILDLGKPTAIDSMALFIEADIDFPALFQWQVYGTSDPEGRVWGPALGPDEVTVTYREWELGRQGWEVRFTSPVTQRWVKLVDVKVGDTEPDIFVTELEVFSPPVEQRDKTDASLSRFRLYGDVHYDILPRLEVNYSTDLYENRSDGASRDLSGAVHQVGSVWRPQHWQVTGYYQISTLTGAARSNTDARTQFLSATRYFPHNIDSRISWKRIDDNSPALDYTTHDINLDVNWRFAPGLIFNQKVGRGLRFDHQSDDEARSWVVMSTVRSTPVPTLSVDLRHVDRWVDQSAGSGFTSFSNTELVTRWSVLPLLAYDSQLVYRMRDGSDWSARNQLSWTPIPGGSVGMTFNVIDYRDTRVDLEQQSVGANITWRARSNTRMEFGAEYVDITQHGEENRPHNLYARGSLNF